MKMSETNLAINIYEEKGRVSVNFKRTFPGATDDSWQNWTFDILSERLFEAVLSQIVKGVKGPIYCQLQMPFHRTDMIWFSDKFLSRMARRYDLDFGSTGITA